MNSLQKSVHLSQLVSSLVGNNKPKRTLNELLNILKEKKRFNHQKFTEYIENELNMEKTQPINLIKIMNNFGEKMEKNFNSYNQIRSVLRGFRNHIMKYLEKENIEIGIRRDFLQHLIQNYFNFPSFSCFLVSQMIENILDNLFPEQKGVYVQQMLKILIEKIQSYSKRVTEDTRKKCCILIYTLDLYSFFKIHDLLFLCTDYNITDIMQFFFQKNGKVRKQLADAYIIRNGAKDPKVTRKFMQQLNLNPMDYPQFVKLLLVKSMKYLLITQPIFVTDLKVQGNPLAIQVLIQILISQNKNKEALHFINKYYVKKFYHLNRSQDKSFNRNILQSLDAFVPTEHILRRFNPKKYEQGYVTLQDLGYHRQNIIIVNRQNITEQMLNHITDSSQFGIDAESPPLFTYFDKKVTSIAQIAVNHNVKVEVKQEESTTNNKNVHFVYILDLIDLRQSNLLKSWLEHLCLNYKGKIVGHTVKQDFNDLVKEILPNSKIQSQNLNFVDIAQIFKQKYNENQCSLSHMCQKILQQKLSKFEQCSGWHNRPLRQAQIHYAAMDAVLPLIINKKMS